MRWLKRIGIGLGVLLALVAAAALAIWIWKPWVPPVVVAEPGPSGRRVIESGLLANYYPGQGQGRRPAILLLGGSEGGIGTSGSRKSQLLASRGFTVLNLSYFRGAGQPERLELAPLETFDRALAWLRGQPEVDTGRIAIVGYSKGAEAALLLASRRPGFKAVVAGMPSSVVWAGVDWNDFISDVSSWSERGEPIPHLPYGSFDYRKGVVSRYENGLARLNEHPDAIIPTERIDAPILLICGERDTLWSSCPMARQILARQRQHGRSNVTLLSYEDAGHAVAGPAQSDGDPAISRLSRLGGSAQGNHAARKDNWPKTLSFLEAALVP